MIRFISTLLAFTILAAPAAVADNIPNSDFAYGNWHGAAYTNSATGEFSHCAMSANYVSGDTLIFTVNRDATVSVAVVSPALVGIPLGQTFPVQLFVDRRPPFYGTATILAEKMAGLTIDDFEAALTAFKKGRTLVINGAGKRGVYDLTGTFRALDATQTCAIRNFHYANRPAPPATSIDRTQMFQVASMVINELGVEDFRYLTADELNDRGWSTNIVAWEAPGEGITGLSMMAERNGSDDLRQTDAGDTQFLASTCRGDFATSSRSIPLPESDARQIRFICRSDGADTEIFLTKFFAGDKVAYNMLSFSGVADQAKPQPKTRQDLSDEATIKSASFLLP